MKHLLKNVLFGLCATLVFAASVQRSVEIAAAATVAVASLKAAMAAEWPMRGLLRPNHVL